MFITFQNQVNKLEKLTIEYGQIKIIGLEAHNKTCVLKR